MKEEIKVPAMGESITEATVGAILKENGASVKVDDEILELETDKVNQVLYAPADGILTLNVSIDDVVKIGDVVGTVNGEGQPKKEKKKEKAAEAKKEPKPQEAPVTSSGAQVDRITKEAFIQEIKSPAAPKAESVKPPQPQAPTPTPVAATHTHPPSATGRETRKRMSKIRQVIASRLVEAQQTTAMLTTFNEVDMEAVMTIRSRYKDNFQKKYGVKLGFMSFFVKAVVSSLKAFPGLNSYLDADELVERHYYDIGIAVSTERGLMVPVIRNCDQLSAPQIEQSIESYAKKAREGGISVEDLQGGSFTITNGGIFGSMLSTPILNPPQSGILGMHNIVKRPVVIDDQIVIRPIMYLALSYDHRIVDGREAVSFLVHVKQCLEDPARLILEL